MNFSFLNNYILILIVLIFVGCSGQNKKDAADFFLKGNHALTQKNYTEALRLYDEAISKNPEFADAYLNKSICLTKLNRVNDAYDVLTEAINADATLIQAFLLRSETGIILGRLNEAETDLKHIEKEYKDSSKFYLTHGNLMEAKSETSMAISDYDKAIFLNALNVEAFVNRGAVHYKLGSLNLAEQDFLSALKLKPSQTEALNNLGLIATKRSDYDGAILYFDKILNFNPADPLALNNKGYALLKKGEIAEAGKLIDRSLDNLPENGYALRNMGLYYQMSGKLNEALTEYNKAIDLAQPVDELYGLTGQAYLLAKDKSSACRIWKQGIILKDAISVSEYNKHCN